MRVIKMKPALFIIHDVKHSGGISYKIQDRESREEGKQELSEWRTTRTIDDKTAFDAARACRSRIETALRKETGAAVSDITGGLFAADMPATWEALERAQEIISEELETFRRDYDSGNKLSSRIIIFKVQGENRALLDALSEQVSDGLDDLKRAVNAADVTQIRAALKSIKGMSQLMPPDAAARLENLMNNYRAKAREINAAVNKQGKSLDEIRQQMDASPIDAASLEIFEPAPDFRPALDTLDAGQFQTEEAETPTGAPTGADTAEFQTEAAPASLPGELDAPAGLQTDETPEADRADDWTETPEAPPAPASAPGLPDDDPDALDVDAAMKAARAK